jgi:putative ABC transport system permease protein
VKLILKLAWRNIWRNWRRAVITMAAVMFAVFLTVLMRGMQLGTYERNIQLTVEMFTSYIQVQVDGYFENPTLRKTFVYSDKIKKILDNNHDIIAYSPRIMADGLIGNEKNSFGAGIFAVNPEAEEKVTNIHSKLDKGRYLSSENIYDIVIGYKLLKNLDAKIGDEIVILSSGYDGSTGNLKFRISGTMKMGSPDFDRSAVFMHIDAARELLSLRNRISAIAVNIEGLDALNQVKNELRNSISNIEIEHNRKLTALDWGELMPDLQQSIEFDNISGVIYLALMMAIVAFGILNTVVMSITERFREFGVLIALGMRQLRLVVIVFFETIFISIIGTIAGFLLGFIVNYYIVLNPIDLSGAEMGEMYEEFGFEPALYSSVQPDIFLNTLLSIFIIVIVVYMIPAYRLFKLEALKGIRYT